MNDLKKLEKKSKNNDRKTLSSYGCSCTCGCLSAGMGRPSEYDSGDSHNTVSGGMYDL